MFWKVHFFNGNIFRASLIIFTLQMVPINRMVGTLLFLKIFPCFSYGGDCDVSA